MGLRRLLLCAAVVAASLGLLGGCAAGVSEEQVSPSPSGPLPLSKAEKTVLGMIADQYRQIAKVNANILAVALKTRPLPNAAVKALNKTLDAKAKVILFWNDYNYPSARMMAVAKAWDKVRKDDMTFTSRLVDFVNHSANDAKMKRAVHALGVMGQDWRRYQTSVKKLRAEAGGVTAPSSPSS